MTLVYCCNTQESRSCLNDTNIYVEGFTETSVFFAKLLSSRSWWTLAQGGKNLQKKWNMNFYVENNTDHSLEKRIRLKLYLEGLGADYNQFFATGYINIHWMMTYITKSSAIYF